jgi:hypothetical protein
MGAQARWRQWLAGRDAAGLAWIGVALVLVLCTLLVFNSLRRFHGVATEWPFDPRFEAVLPGGAPALADDGRPVAGRWEIEGDPKGVSIENGTLRLRNDDPEAVVGLRQVWRLDPNGPHTFLLAATLASKDVVGQRRGYRFAEVTLVADDTIGRAPLRSIHRLAALKRTTGPARYVDLFEFPSGTRLVELAIRLRHVVGEVSVRGLEVKALQERRLFGWARLALQLAWAATLAAGCWLFWRDVDHRRSGLVLIAAAAAGMVLLLMPQGLRNTTLMPLMQLVPARLLGPEDLANLGHFAIFVAAGALTRLSRRQEPWPRQLVLLVGVAGLAELLQFMAELRSAELDDWLTNAAGALAGWLPAMAWLRLRQDGQFATQRGSSTTLPPQAAKQSR